MVVLKAAVQGFARAEKNTLQLEEDIHKQQHAARLTSPSAAPMRTSPAILPSASPTCANCVVPEAAGGGALKPHSRCKAVVYFYGKPYQAQRWKAGGYRAMCSASIDIAGVGKGYLVLMTRKRQQ
jgi:hypothetical protein